MKKFTSIIIATVALMSLSVEVSAAGKAVGKEAKIPVKVVSFAQRPSVNIPKLGDPFKSYLIKLSIQKKQIMSDYKNKTPNRKITALEKIPLSSMRFSGVYKMGDELIAMIEDNEGKGYVAYGGDYIGDNNGMILRIGKTTITIVEKVVDKYGNLKDKVVDLKLDRGMNKKKKKA